MRGSSGDASGPRLARRTWVDPAGAPFFKYNVIDMDRELELEAGVPVDGDGDGDVFAAELPAGRFATLTHVGHPQELGEVTAGLLTNPAEVPDPAKWETQLAFRLKS